MQQSELGRRALVRGLIALAAVGDNLLPDEAIAAKLLPEAEAIELLLARKITFFGGTEFDRIGPEMFEVLKDLPVGRKDYAVDVGLTSPDHITIRTVRTVREYDQ